MNINTRKLSYKFLSTTSPVDKSTTSKSTTKDVVKTLLTYVWPSLEGHYTNEEVKKRKDHRFRVKASLGMMALGKGVNVGVPFLFKYLVDDLTEIASKTSDISSHADLIAQSGDMAAAAAGTPLLLLLGYGFSRTLTSVLNEARNTTFATVAQSTIRGIGLTTFQHVHKLGLGYHESSSTGVLSRVMERGTRSMR